MGNSFEALIASLITAAIMLIAILIGAFLIGGRYTVTAVDSYHVRTDRLTGEMVVCFGRNCSPTGPARVLYYNPETGQMQDTRPAARQQPSS